MSIHVTVKLFAVLRDRAGTNEVAVELPAGATAADAADAAAGRFPAIRPHLATAAVAVNLAYAARSTPLADGDEVALIPPVSGG